jgi:hypothetical protein
MLSNKYIKNKTIKIWGATEPLTNPYIYTSHLHLAKDRNKKRKKWNIVVNYVERKIITLIDDFHRQLKYCELFDNNVNPIYINKKILYYRQRVKKLMKLGFKKEKKKKEIRLFA